MVAVRDVVIPLALWASQEKEDVLFRPGESYEGVAQCQRGEGAAPGPPPTMPSLKGLVQPTGVPAWRESVGWGDDVLGT